MLRPAFGRANERRRVARRQGGSRAYLTFNRGAAVIECTVRDFASGGARVHVQKKISPPDTVYLVFPEGNCAYEAIVPWRNESLFGLHFNRVIDLTGELPLEIRFLKWVASDHRKTA